MAIIELDIQDFLPLGQTDGHTPKALTLLQPFPLSDLAVTNHKLLTVQQLYSPAQQATLRRAVVNMSILQSLPLYQQGAKTHSEHIIDIFFMWQQGRPAYFEEITHALSLVQTVIVVQAKGATNTFTITHTATWNTVRPRSLTNTFVPVSKAAQWQADKYKYNIELPTLTGPNAPEC